jgi:uncharacterized protein
MGLMTTEIRPALQGAIPAALYTCSLEGVPNAAVISQVYWVDEDHVALSFQFFNKTNRNIRENPFAYVEVFDPAHGWIWNLELQFERSENSGSVFEEMEMQLEAIASATGMSGVFHLKAADIYKVLSVRKVSG